ncbi:MAG: hypothetical protein Q7J47_04830 [Azoarcus sp.]|nr:hypothetical protein [Azoarcus sp.]
MREKAKISFYEISDCGYFKRGKEHPVFGSIAATLQNLDDWSQGKSLAETKTFEPADGEDVHPAYLMDIRKLGDTWLVSIWNQTPANESGVASIRGNSSVGSAEVVMNDIEKGSIPGFATYFWFIPSRNLFASIRFQHLWTGQQSLQKYVEAFLASFSNHVVYSDDDDQVEILGYANDPAKDAPINLYPRFRTGLLRKPGARELIQQNRINIRKVIRKTVLKLDREEDLSKWQSLLRWTHMEEPAKHPDKVRVQYELNGAMTEDDLQAIFEDWDAGHESEWDDYGFMFLGQSAQPYWLSHTLARSQFELDVTRDSEEVVNAESLLNALLENRVEIIKLTE